MALLRRVEHPTPGNIEVLVFCFHILLLNVCFVFCKIGSFEVLFSCGVTLNVLYNVRFNAVLITFPDCSPTKNTNIKSFFTRYLTNQLFQFSIFNTHFAFPCWFFKAWEDTYAKWDQSTKQILNFPKNKGDDGQVSTFMLIFSLKLNDQSFKAIELYNLHTNQELH